MYSYWSLLGLVRAPFLSTGRTAGPPLTLASHMSGFPPLPFLFSAFSFLFFSISISPHNQLREIVHRGLPSPVPPPLLPSSTKQQQAGSFILDLRCQMKRGGGGGREGQNVNVRTMVEEQAKGGKQGEGSETVEGGEASLGGGREGGEWRRRNGGLEVCHVV